MKVFRRPDRPIKKFEVGVIRKSGIHSFSWYDVKSRKEALKDGQKDFGVVKHDSWYAKEA